MKKTAIFLLSASLLMTACATGKSTDTTASKQAIISGVAWYDQNGNEVNAHGTCIVKEGDLYYMFGEHKKDSSNAFIGFACYSSPDLVNWTFENVSLPRQASGLLGPDRVGERPKVMKCPSTGEYVMYMHCDDLAYKDQHIGYATCATIDGDYEFHGALLYEGEPVRRWDMGTFQDTDGTGYLLLHHGIIYRLSADYRSAEERVLDGLPNSGESPAMFKKNGTYYLLGSGLTSWERNDNFYFTATDMKGPWTRRGLFAPEGTLTWNSQCTFVLPVVSGVDTMFMYMGDRWSFPLQGSAATYVWQPIAVGKDGAMSVPEFHQAWTIDLEKASWSSVETGFDKLVTKGVETSGQWQREGTVFRAKEKGATLSYTFKGTQIAVRGTSDNMSGYARLFIYDKDGGEVLSTILDLYSKYELDALKFVSPVLEKGEYTLKIEVAGFHPIWTDKTKTIYGSKDDYVTISGISVK